MSLMTRDLHHDCQRDWTLSGNAIFTALGFGFLRGKQGPWFWRPQVLLRKSRPPVVPARVGACLGPVSPAALPAGELQQLQE